MSFCWILNDLREKRKKEEGQGKDKRLKVKGKVKEIRDKG